MRIAYLARSFLDYRVPVLAALDKLCQGQLHYISSSKWTPERVLRRLSGVLGERAVLLSGERSIGVDMPNESNRSICLPYQPGLLHTLARIQPEVIIGDGFFQWTSVALLHRLVHGTPLVVCYERWAHTERRAQWYRKLYRRLALNFAAAVCCNGRLSAEYTQALGFPAHRITTGHMAADTETLALQSQKLPPDTARRLRDSFRTHGVVFLYVGRLIKMKGLDKLLDAWAGLEAQYPAGATLLIVGAGPEEQNLQRQTESLGLRQVRLVGPVDYARLAPYYVSADAFVIPTLEDNWSLVVPEAMACGLPILCSQYNGCWPELVQQEQNGWVFDPLDYHSTLDSLKKAMQDTSRLSGMGSESRRIIAKHSPAHAAQAIYAACKLAFAPKA